RLADTSRSPHRRWSHSREIVAGGPGDSGRGGIAARHRPPSRDPDFGADWDCRVWAWAGGSEDLDDPRHKQGADMLREWSNYIKAWLGNRSEEIKDPEIEIEQAIQEAQKRDQDLRNQAAKVIAHRTQVENELGDAADDLGEAEEMAKRALLTADAAQKA